MRGIVPYEFAIHALGTSIRDVQDLRRVIASDPHAIARLNFELSVLTRTVDEVKEMAERAA